MGTVVLVVVTDNADVDAGTAEVGPTAGTDVAPVSAEPADPSPHAASASTLNNAPRPARFTTADYAPAHRRTAGDSGRENL